MEITNSIFREYDIRGVYPEELNEESVNYINESLRIRADKAEINLLSKKLNISMKNDKDKIFINGQY